MLDQSIFLEQEHSMRSSSSTDMVIFRENTEDIYAEIEWEANSEGVQKF